MPDVAAAHGTPVPRELPVPGWLFAWASSLVLIISFAALAIPRRATPRARQWTLEVPSALSSPRTLLLTGLTGALLLALVIWTGLAGTQLIDRNFAVTFVFVTTWIGLALLSAVVGDVFWAFNPWRGIAQLIDLLAPWLRRRPLLTYPAWLGCWPASLGLAAFLWFELVYGQLGFAINGGISPRATAVAAIGYSVWTLLGIALFGTRTWLAVGETFSVFFRMFAALSPLSWRAGRIHVGLPLDRASEWADQRGRLAMVLITVGGTVFDGAQETVLQRPIQSAFETVSSMELDLGVIATLRVASSMYFVATLALVAAIYWIGVAGMPAAPGRVSRRQVGLLLAPSLIPIALGYLFSHYFTLLVYSGQAQFTYLLSDPFATGADYFGTADIQPSYALFSSGVLWFLQAGALVVGHVIALWMGHRQAVTLYGDGRSATRSQYLMLLMMVTFTIMGLFLLSRGNG